MSILHFADTTSALVGEQIALTGTLNSPNRVFGVDGTDDGNWLGSATAGWAIAASDSVNPYLQKGSMMRFENDFGSPTYWSTYQSATTWNSDKDFIRNYFVRATSVAGDVPTGGSALDSWLAVQPDGGTWSWYWQCSSKYFCESLGTLKLEIAIDIFNSSFDTTSGVNSGTEVITTDAVHGLTTGDSVRYNKDGGSVDVGLLESFTYYVNVISTTTFSLHGIRANALGDISRINITASGAETHLFSSTGNILATGYYAGDARVLT